jgi:transposase
MSTSLLYHGFSIRGYQFQRCLFTHGRIVFKLKQRRVDLRCPRCGSQRLKLKGSFSRVFRTTPIGLKPVFIEFAIPKSRVSGLQVHPTGTRCFCRCPSLLYPSF